MADYWPLLAVDRAGASVSTLWGETLISALKLELSLMVSCKVYFDILNVLIVDHGCDRQTEGQTLRARPELHRVHFAVKKN